MSSGVFTCLPEARREKDTAAPAESPKAELSATKCTLLSTLLVAALFAPGLSIYLQVAALVVVLTGLGRSH